MTHLLSDIDFLYAGIKIICLTSLYSRSIFAAEKNKTTIGVVIENKK